MTGGVEEEEETTVWRTVETSNIGIAIANFSLPEASSSESVTPLRIGDLVCIVQQCKDWYHGRNLSTSQTGVFPKNCVKAWAARSDLIQEEVILAIHNWKPLWKQLYEEGDTSKFSRICQLVERLAFLRRQLQITVLTQEQASSLRVRMADCVDEGNAALGLETVPREENGAAVGISPAAGIVHLFNRYLVAQRKRDASEPVPQAKLSEEPLPTSSLNLFLMVKLGNFLYPKLEEDILLFAYVVRRQVNSGGGGGSEFISEKALLDPKENERSILFLDLPDCHNVYLICNAYRNLKPSTETPTRRPFAVSVVGPLRNLKFGEAKTLQTKFYLCDDKDFFNLHELIIRNSSGLKSLWTNSRLDLSVQLMRSSEAVGGGCVSQEHRALFASSVLARKIGFSNVIVPGVVRNDLYLTLENGAFDRGGKTRNVEVSACAVDQHGNLIKDCFCEAAGLKATSVVVFPVLYHTNSPTWMETVRLQIPIEAFQGTHVRLEFRHCSNKDKSDKKLLGFSFFHLMELDGTTVKDGAHSLCIYKCEDMEQLSDCNVYLSLAARLSDMKNSEQVTIQRGFVRSSKESVTIRTRLCSTKLTQNVYLMSLLNWKSNPAHLLNDTLRRTMLVEGEELVKFLQDVFDALFEMFTTEDGNSTGHSGLVFQVLVYIISSLQNPKFKQFGQVIDTYINEHFSAALVYKGLLTCLRHFTDHVSSNENQEPIQKCFQSLEYLFKLIVRSRILFIRTSVGQTDNSFRDSVKLLFDSFNKMLVHSSESFQHTQTVFLRHISSVYPHVLLILPVIDVAEFVTLMFATLCRGDQLPPALSEALLDALQQTVNSQLFQDSESRELFLTTCCKLINKYLLLGGRYLPRVSDLLGDIVMFLTLRRKQQQSCRSMAINDVDTLAELLLGPLVQTILRHAEEREEDEATGAKGRLLSCLLSLLQLMQDDDFRALWERLNMKQELKPFLLECFLLFRTVLTSHSPIFPREWQSLRAVLCGTTLATMQEFAKPLLIYFREERQFDVHLWMSYFTLGVTFLAFDDLNLERMTDLARHRAFRWHGDLRLKMGYQILSIWSHLGDLKQYFIPGIVGPLLKMTLIPEQDMRKSAIPVFFDLLEYDYRLKGHFKQVESELVDKLDILVQENKVDEDYKDLFATLLNNILSERNPIWLENGRSFIDSVTTLLDRLLQYRSALQSGASGDKQMSCIVSLLDYYKAEPNCQELFQRYLYKLHDLHLPSENYVEAGFTLKLHADHLTWSKRTLHADLRYPSQKEWERKEQLYLRIIDLFEMGKYWEHAIPLCKELAEVYEHKVFDYSKLSTVLQRQASLFEKIVSSSEQALRVNPEYFRVGCFHKYLIQQSYSFIGFYGAGFPHLLRNKEFVYRGHEFEKLPVFTQRISDEFPGAKVLPTNSPPDVVLKMGQGQHVQICCVRPICSRDGATESLEGYPIPGKIRQSHERLSISKFHYDRPLPKGPKTNQSEGNLFRTLWLERTTLSVSTAFPSILRWLEVTESKVDQIPPVAHACEMMEAKNYDILQMIEDQDDGQIQQKLSLSLQGVIDAAVNGGVAKYQEAFFSPGFAAEHPEFADDVARLQRLMVEQVDVLEQALAEHERLISPEVRPLHDHLMGRWRIMKESLATLPASAPLRRSSTQQLTRRGPLPPVPADQCKGRSRSSLSSSIYNQGVSDDDGSIYSQPSLETDRQLMTVSLTSLPFPASPLRVRVEVDHKCPPLPPRLSGGSYYSLKSPFSSLGSESPPPIPPKSSSSTNSSPRPRKSEFME